MADRTNVDVANLKVTGTTPTAPSVSIHDGVIVIVTEAYGPNGESLIDASHTFDGFPAIALWVEAGEESGMVYLSPIHGDRRKSGLEHVASGTRCRLFTPKERVPLTSAGSTEDGAADYFSIYLSPKLEHGSSVYVSDAWNHYNSGVLNDHELISAYAP